VDGGSRHYADILGAIGSRLDERGGQDIVLCEVVDGFIASVTPTQNAAAEGWAFSFEELTAMLGAEQSPGEDSGAMSYRRLLTALGSELDRAHARMISVLELPIGLVVSFYPDGYQLEGCYGPRNEFVYQPEGLRDLLAGVAT
jgi:hypothetical protein